MQIIADLQLHSKYSRAVSPQMTIPNIGLWAARKGIGLVATGDWTHPLWIREIQAAVEEEASGFLKLKDESILADLPNLTLPKFLLATEVSCIYGQAGKLRRVHVLIWVQSLSAAEKINTAMAKRGCRLLSDGRPIIGLTLIQVADLVLNIEPSALLIPAHAWTPFFAVYGSASGFDSIAEAFGPFAKNVYAIETGLSSNPSMNWRIKELDNRAILSFSDAHSGPKIGRESTVFEVPGNQFNYQSIYDAIKVSTPHLSSLIPLSSITYTIEFYPEEGKYHYTGHRNCGVKFSPQETVSKGTVCPVCGRPLTQGVMQRVEELAGRSEVDLKLSTISGKKVELADEVQLTSSQTFPYRPPFVMLVPLQEIIAEAIGSPVTSPKTQSIYFRLVEELGGEFKVLLTAETDAISRIAGSRVAEGISKVRRRDIVIDPGYDGVFGTVKIWGEETEAAGDSAGKEQLALF